MKILETRGLRKSFEDHNGVFDAVKDVCLSIEPGKVLGFLGPNGAGKTTTIKMIAGLIEPNEGTIEVLGRNPIRESKCLADIGAVLEGNRNIYWRLTALENVQYFGVLKGLSMKEALHRGHQRLEELGLGKKKNVPVRKFSRGMQQKVALAAALIHDPKLLLLDEPTLGLDAMTTEKVKELIRKNAAGGRAILLTTHQLGIAEELSDELAIIRDGQLVAYNSTGSLIDAFSGDHYDIHLTEALDPPRRDRIKALGAWVKEDGSLGFQGTTDTLYDLIAALRPLQILEIKKDRANLEGIFLKLVNEDA